MPAHVCFCAFVKGQAKSEQRAKASQELHKKARDWGDCSGWFKRGRGKDACRSRGQGGAAEHRSKPPALWATLPGNARPGGGEERRCTRRQDEEKRSESKTSRQEEEKRERQRPKATELRAFKERQGHLVE